MMREILLQQKKDQVGWKTKQNHNVHNQMWSLFSKHAIAVSIQCFLTLGTIFAVYVPFCGEIYITLIGS